MNLPPSVGDGNCYYILTEGCTYGSKYFPPGSLCCCSERSYLRSFADRPSARFLKVMMLDEGSTVTVTVEILQPVRREVAALLLGIGGPSERLDSFLERLSLEAALQAGPGQKVTVEIERQHFPGVIRYVGSIHKSPLAALSPVFFGVELQVSGQKRASCCFFFSPLPFITVLSFSSLFFFFFRARGRTEGAATAPTTAPSISSVSPAAGSSCPSAESVSLPAWRTSPGSKSQKWKRRRGCP